MDMLGAQLFEVVLFPRFCLEVVLRVSFIGGFTVDVSIDEVQVDIPYVSSQ